jgi:hypothetical protein
MMETKYYQVKVQILALVAAFLEGDEAAREDLKKKADFFPISARQDSPEGFQSMMVRVKGELFLVEDTKGGEHGVFALLQPLM